MNRLQWDERGGPEDMEQDELLRQLGGTAEKPEFPESDPQLGRIDAPPVAPDPMGMAAPDVPAVDKSRWNTDSYAAPQRIAEKFGAVPSGWDADKWADPNHQTPKYATRRLIDQFDPNDPAQIPQAAAAIAEAYPGAVFNGKDKITMPDGAVIDFVVGASGTGPKSWGWQPLEDGPQQGDRQMHGGMGGQPSMSSLVPTDMGTYNTLQAKIAEILGGQDAFSQDALMKQLGVR